jgi:hypothetical protein
MSKATPAAKEHGGNRKDQGYKDGKHNLDRLQRGTSKEYRLARLKRDHPEIGETAAAASPSAKCWHEGRTCRRQPRKEGQKKVTMSPFR